MESVLLMDVLREGETAFFEVINSNDIWSHIKKEQQYQKLVGVRIEDEEKAFFDVMTSGDIWTHIRKHITFEKGVKTRYEDYKSASSALSCGYYDLVKERRHVLVFSQDCLWKLIKIRIDDRELIDCVVKKCKEFFDNNEDPVYEALHSKKYDIVESLIKHGYTCGRHTIASMIMAGLVWALQEVVAQSGWPQMRFMQEEAVNLAVRRGHYKMIEFLSSHMGNIGLLVGAIKVAWESKKDDIVELLHPICPTFESSVICEDVDYIKRSKKGACEKIHIERILKRHGNVEIIKELRRREDLVCGTKSLDIAAGRGYLDVVRFIHSEFGDCATTKAMDDAAAGGFLDVVEFLFVNRKEGCTVKATNAAAANGDLDMITFLHFNGLIKPDNNALEIAQIMNHHHVWDFLKERENEMVGVVDVFDENDDVTLGVFDEDDVVLG